MIMVLLHANILYILYRNYIWRKTANIKLKNLLMNLILYQLASEFEKQLLCVICMHTFILHISNYINMYIKWEGCDATVLMWDVLYVCLLCIMV